MEIVRTERKRRCRCNQNFNKISCGHRPVKEVEWELGSLSFHTKKRAIAYASEHEIELDNRPRRAD